MRTKKIQEAIPSSILGCMEMIVSRGGEVATKVATYLAELLCLTTNQALLLAFFCSRAEDSRIMLSEIAHQMGCTYLHLLKLSGDIDVLVFNHYLQKTRYNGTTTYAVNREALNALCHNKAYVYMPKPIKSIADFIDHCCELVFDVRHHNISPEDFILEVESALGKGKSIKEVKWLMSIDGMTPINIAVLLYMANSLISDNDEEICTDEMTCLFESHSSARMNTSMLNDGSHVLIISGLVESHCDDGLSSQKYYRLTDKAKSLLFPGMSFATNSISIRNYINANEVKSKKLFFSTSVQMQVDELASMLMPRKYKHIITRLDECGLRKGIACLLWGEPGTGKTELALQIAKKTGRDIIKVDMANIRDKYVGESEKRVKAVFDDYRRACSSAKHTPLLLLNEADAVLGKRLSNVSTSVDQMSNTIQNILLEEIENLDGILIATTNLVDNLDSAFERRFLYKIKFTRPDKDTLSAIIKSQIPNISASDARKLAHTFALSGAEVENVARKANVKYILNGKKATFADLTTLCKEEVSLHKKSTIGFTK